MFQEWERKPSLILESINMLAWVNVPEDLAAFLGNKKERFGVKGQGTDKDLFMVTGGKDADLWDIV